MCEEQSYSRETPGVETRTDAQGFFYRDSFATGTSTLKGCSVLQSQSRELCRVIFALTLKLWRVIILARIFHPVAPSLSSTATKTLIPLLLLLQRFYKR